MADLPAAGSTAGLFGLIAGLYGLTVRVYGFLFDCTVTHTTVRFWNRKHTIPNGNQKKPTIKWINGRSDDMT